MANQKVQANFNFVHINDVQFFLSPPPTHTHKGKDIDFKSCSSRVAADWVREPQGVCTSNQWTMYSFCTWYDKIDLTLYPYEKKNWNLYRKLL